MIVWWLCLAALAGSLVCALCSLHYVTHVPAPEKVTIPQTMSLTEQKRIVHELLKTEQKRGYEWQRVYTRRNY